MWNLRNVVTGCLVLVAVSQSVFAGEVRSIEDDERRILEAQISYYIRHMQPDDVERGVVVSAPAQIDILKSHTSYFSDADQRALRSAFVHANDRAIALGESTLGGMPIVERTEIARGDGYDFDYIARTYGRETVVEIRRAAIVGDIAVVVIRKIDPVAAVVIDYETGFRKRADGAWGMVWSRGAVKPKPVQ